MYLRDEWDDDDEGGRGMITCLRYGSEYIEMTSRRDNFGWMDVKKHSGISKNDRKVFRNNLWRSKK